MIKVEKLKGKFGVSITEDKDGIELMVTKNGFQWTGVTLNEELINMLQYTITEFKIKQKYL